MISNMPHLTTYNMELYTLTPNILRVMDTNEMKLKNLKLWNSDDEVEDTIPNDYYSLVSSTSTKSLESLAIKRAHNASFSKVSIFTNTLIMTPNCLENLVDLHFDHPALVHKSFPLLDSILQNMKNLENLSFHDLDTNNDEKTDDEDLERRAIIPCKLKELNLRVKVLKDDYDTMLLNNKLKLVLLWRN